MKRLLSVVIANILLFSACKSSFSIVAIEIEPSNSEETQAATESHIYSNWTRYDPKEHWGKCDICSRITYEAHEWDDGMVTKEPTFTATGVLTYTCTDCGATRTQTISKLTTSEEIVITSAPITTTAVSERVTTVIVPVTTSSIAESVTDKPISSKPIPETTTTIPKKTTTVPETPTSSLTKATATTESMALIPETSVSIRSTSVEQPETSVSTPETSELSSPTPTTIPTLSDQTATNNTDKPVTTAIFNVNDWTVEKEVENEPIALYILLGLLAMALAVILIVVFLTKRNGSGKNAKMKENDTEEKNR